MPIPGNSFVPNLGYWSGDPTSVPTTEFNPPAGGIVFDLSGGPPRVCITTGNVAFAVIALNGQPYSASTIASTGSILSSSPTGGVGYSAGSGGTVTQLTNRTTGVTLNKTTGAITTATSSLAPTVAAAFVVTNSSAALNDTVVLSIQSGSNGGNTSVTVSTVTAGSFTILVSNNNPSGGTAETGAIIVNFAVFKGAQS